MSDLLEYDLAPRLRALGGDVWIEEVQDQVLVIGFSAAAGTGSSVLDLLRASLTRLAGGQTGWFELRDRTPRAAG